MLMVVDHLPSIKTTRWRAPESTIPWYPGDQEKRLQRAGIRSKEWGRVSDTRIRSTKAEYGLNGNKPPVWDLQMGLKNISALNSLLFKILRIKTKEKLPPPGIEVATFYVLVLFTYHQTTAPKYSCSIYYYKQRWINASIYEQMCWQTNIEHLPFLFK